MQRWLQQQIECENVHAVILSPVTTSMSNRTRSAGFERQRREGGRREGWGWGQDASKVTFPTDAEAKEEEN